MEIIFLQRKTTSMHKFTKYISGGHLHIFSKICIIIKKRKNEKKRKEKKNMLNLQYAWKAGLMGETWIFVQF